MIELSNDTVEYIQSVIKTAGLCGIDAIAIETDIVRGQSADNPRGMFLMETDNIPKLEFAGLGIGRAKVLSNRIKILDSNTLKVKFEPKERDNGDIIAKKMELKSKNTKIEFSCYDPMRIKAPRRFNDPFYYSFNISEDTVQIMSKTFSAIDTSQISFSNDKDGTVKFRTSDNEGDIFEHLIANKYEITEDAEKDNFFFGYQIKFLLPLFKAALNDTGNIALNISKRGVLKVMVNGFCIYTLPEA